MELICCLTYWRIKNFFTTQWRLYVFEFMCTHTHSGKRQRKTVVNLSLSSVSCVSVCALMCMSACLNSSAAPHRPHIVLEETWPLSSVWPWYIYSSCVCVCAYVSVSQSVYESVCVVCDLDRGHQLWCGCRRKSILNSWQQTPSPTHTHTQNIQLVIIRLYAFPPSYAFLSVF